MRAGRTTCQGEGRQRSRRRIQAQLWSQHTSQHVGKGRARDGGWGVQHQSRRQEGKPRFQATASTSGDPGARRVDQEKKLAPSSADLVGAMEDSKKLQLARRVRSADVAPPSCSREMSHAIERSKIVIASSGSPLHNPRILASCSSTFTTSGLSSSATNSSVDGAAEAVLGELRDHPGR